MLKTEIKIVQNQRDTLHGWMNNDKELNLSISDLYIQWTIGILLCGSTKLYYCILGMKSKPESSIMDIKDIRDFQYIMFVTDCLHTIRGGYRVIKRSSPEFLIHSETGIRPPPSLVFLPFTQNIFRQPIPENSWPYKSFYCGCP